MMKSKYNKFSRAGESIGTSFTMSEKFLETKIKIDKGRQGAFGREFRGGDKLFISSHTLLKVMFLPYFFKK